MNTRPSPRSLTSQLRHQGRRALGLAGGAIGTAGAALRVARGAIRPSSVARVASAGAHALREGVARRSFEPTSPPWDEGAMADLDAEVFQLRRGVLEAITGGRGAHPGGEHPTETALVWLPATGDQRLPMFDALAKVGPHLAELSEMSVFLVEPPWDPASYGDLTLQVDHITRLVEGILTRCAPERVILVGLSKGGAMALFVGGALAERHPGTQFVVASLSPALAQPELQHPFVELFAGMLGVARLGERLSEGSQVGAAASRRIFGGMQLLLTTLAMAELDTLSGETLVRLLPDLLHRDPVACAVRACREYELLRRVPDEHLEAQLAQLGTRLRGLDNLQGFALFGQQDVWVDALRCRDKLTRACGDAIETVLLPHRGHAIGRGAGDHAQDCELLAERIRASCGCATRSTLAAK